MNKVTWISVDHSLPSSDEIVLIYINHLNKISIGYCQLIVDDVDFQFFWTEINNTNFIDETVREKVVTHWAELPKPPQE